MLKVDEYGAGIVCPFQRDGKGDFVNESGLRLLASDVRELIGIIGPTNQKAGELPWNTDIGTRLLMLKHRGFDEMLQPTAEEIIAGPVREYEPRVISRGVEVDADTNQGTLTIRFNYTPIGDKTAQNVEVEL